MIARGEATAHATDGDTVDIGRWQPDFVLISRKRKKTAILELTRPSESMEETQRRWDNLADSIRLRSRGGTGSCLTPSIPSHIKKKKARESKGEG